MREHWFSNQYHLLWIRPPKWWDYKIRNGTIQNRKTTLNPSDKNFKLNSNKKAARVVWGLQRIVANARLCRRTRRDWGRRRGVVLRALMSRNQVLQEGVYHLVYSQRIQRVRALKFKTLKKVCQIRKLYFQSIISHFIQKKQAIQCNHSMGNNNTQPQGNKYLILHNWSILAAHKKGWRVCRIEAYPKGMSLANHSLK